MGMGYGGGGGGGEEGDYIPIAIPIPMYKLETRTAIEMSSATVTASLPAKIALRAVRVYNHRLGRRKGPWNRSVNPFTALLAAPSLRKRPSKVPNFKSLKAFFPLLREHLKGFLSKRTVLKADLCLQIYCLRARMCAFFSPDVLQAGAVEGLNRFHSYCSGVGSLLKSIVIHRH